MIVEVKCPLCEWAFRGESADATVAARAHGAHHPVSAWVDLATRLDAEVRRLRELMDLPRTH